MYTKYKRIRNNTITLLKSYGYNPTEYKKGIIKIGFVLFWTTSEIIYDEENQFIGLGINSLLKYLRDKERSKYHVV